MASSCTPTTICDPWQQFPALQCPYHQLQYQVRQELLPLHPCHRLNWGKVVFVNALLTRQYDVFLSDLDTVWLKDAHRTMVMALDKYDADVVGAEGWTTCGWNRQG